MKKKRTIWLVASFGALLLALITSRAFQKNGGEVMLENRSNDEISRASVRVCRQTFEFLKMRRGETRSVKYEIGGDSHYDVDIEFQSGRRLSTAVGYVTNGIDFKDKLIVRDDAILLERGEIR